MLLGMLGYFGAATIVVLIIMGLIKLNQHQIDKNRIIDHKEPVSSIAEKAYKKAFDKYVESGNQEDLDKALEFVTENGYEYPSGFGDWTWHENTEPAVYTEWNSPHRYLVGEKSPEPVTVINDSGKWCEFDGNKIWLGQF